MLGCEFEYGLTVYVNAGDKLRNNAIKSQGVVIKLPKKHNQ